MGEFQNVITYMCSIFQEEEPLTTPITTINQWTDLKLSGPAGATGLTNIARNSTLNSVNLNSLDAGQISLNTTGIYIMQFVLTVSGTGSAIYQMRAVQNENTETGSLAELSAIQFTTRGTGVSWEVANTFLINAEPNETHSNSESKRQGLLSSINKIGWQVRNTSGAGDFNIVNGIYNIYKIG
jgi:hypothetical protein